MGLRPVGTKKRTELNAILCWHSATTIGNHEAYVTESRMRHVKGNSISHTYPEVFIIESLTLEDEELSRFEGKILYDILKLSGKNPKYYYFRTKDELVLLAQLFRESDYRFLHISCHGTNTDIQTTLDNISYIEFSEIFEGLLRNRRLFISACAVGNELFSTVLFGRNKGMYSIAGPIENIEFSKAIGLWGAFYTKAFSVNQGYVKNDVIKSAIQNLCNLFDIRFYWSWHDTFNNSHKIEEIKSISQSKIRNASNFNRRNTRKQHTSIKCGDASQEEKPSEQLVNQVNLLKFGTEIQPANEI